MDQLSAALSSRSADPNDGVFRWLDRASVIDWIIIQELSRNGDAFKLSVHLYRSNVGRAHLVPWDFDLSMGQPTIAPGPPEPPGGERSDGFGNERTPFIQDIIAVPGVPEAVAARWRELRRGVLRSSDILRQIGAHAAVFTGHVDANFERWPLERVRFQHIYGPFSLYPVQSHTEEVRKLKTWLQERLTWLDDNIDDFERGNR